MRHPGMQIVFSLLMVMGGTAAAGDRAYAPGYFQIELQGAKPGLIKPVEGNASAKQEQAPAVGQPTNGALKPPGALMLKPPIAAGAVAPGSLSPTKADPGRAQALPATPQPQPKPLPQPGTPRPGEIRPASPDLLIEQLAPGADALRPAVLKIRNAGGLQSGATNVKIDCRAVDGYSNCVGGQLMVNVGPLAAGATTTLTIPLTQMAKDKGALRSSNVHACVDSSNLVRESEEANNCRLVRW